MPNPPMSRMVQLDATFRTLGVDNARVYPVTNRWSDAPSNNRLRFHASWADESDRPPVVVTLVGNDALQLMVLGGIEMSKQLAIQRPELTFPDVVWT